MVIFALCFPSSATDLPGYSPEDEKQRVVHVVAPLSVHRADPVHILGLNLTHGLVVPREGDAQPLPGSVQGLSVGNEGGGIVEPKTQLGEMSKRPSAIEK